MTSQQILNADLLDILFEQRNKAYGAYQLRKEYHRQMAKAVAIALGAAFLVAILIRPSFSKTAIAADEPDVILRTVDFPKQDIKKPELQKPIPTQRVQVKQMNFTDHIQIKENVITPVQPIDALKDVAISNTTTDGKEVGALQPPVPETKETGQASNATEAEPKKELQPDKQPQFPGGMQAWLAFLNRNLQAPEELESGEKKTVLIRFHVAEDGSVTNFKIEQSAGAAFDEEVIRVLKKMPKWTPAMQGGRPLSVSFTQPVTFVGVNE